MSLISHVFFIEFFSLMNSFDLASLCKLVTIHTHKLKFDVASFAAQPHNFIMSRQWKPILQGAYLKLGDI